MKKLICLLLSVMMLFSLSAMAEDAAEGLFTPGTYTAEAQGIFSPIAVTITVTANKIVGVTINAKGETATLGGLAAEQMGEAILKAQTPNVDGLSGATVSSDAIRKAACDACVQAGADLEKLDANRKDAGAAAAKEEKEIETDVVVIGAGGAGMAAAIMLKQAGTEFVMLEKMPYAGGNTTKATGGMNAAETHYQKEQGIEDSTALFAADTMKGGHALNDPALVATMANESAGAIDWLDTIGAELPKISFSGGASVNRIHAPEDGSGVGEYLVQRFSAKLDELGVGIMYDTAATELLTDEEGKICGVKAEGKETLYTIKCKAVILATGGFGANEEMYTQYRPDLKGTVTTNAPGATGDGIVMAQALGADLVDIEQIQLHPTVEQTTSMLITESVRGDGAILVNQGGVRFTNELLTRDAVSAAELEQEGCYAYIIFDQNLRDHLKAIEKYVKSGITVQADTIEGLAEQLGIEPAVLKKTVDDWNGYVKDQRDPDFGRTTGMNADLTTAPYYAIKIAPGIHHTMGGVKIDTSAHVINTEGKIIPGLYAAGEVTGGVHGGNRLGGNAVADIVIFGRIAAETAISELGGEVPAEAPAEVAAQPAEGDLFVPGTYTAEAQGLLSTVTVNVTVDEKEIISVDIDASGETATLGGVAAEMMSGTIPKAQTPNVDTVSGATVTSNAIIEAATKALTEAGADIAVLDANRRDQGGEGAAKEEKTVDTEVVIVGAGGAGMTAAIMLKQAGTDFVLIEKMPYAGGNTTKATGGMNAAETHYQKEQGIEDSVDLFVADTIKGGHDLNDPELVRVMAEKSSDAIDWLDTIGAELPKISFSGGASVNRIHAPEDGSGVGEYLVQHFSEKLEELGVEIMYNTKATELVTDGDGKVCGVKAEGQDCAYLFNCKAVILATGGFGANEEMYTQYRPDLKGTVTTNAPGATGDGIVMAQALGADLVDIEQIQLHPTVEQTTSMLITESVRGDGAILVNQSGVRFTNELLTRDAVSAAELEQEGCYAYIIFDQNLRDHLKAIEKYVKTGITVQADTIEGLAEQLGIEPAVLAKTLADWNECVKNQNDPEFGRTTGMEADLTTAPYYAIKIAPGIHHTMGGVKIDTSAHVINTEGKIIPGLYAAGEVTGGVHGGNRLGGNAVADIVIFGRIAAETAISELGGEAPAEAPAEEPAEEAEAPAA